MNRITANVFCEFRCHRLGNSNIGKWNITHDRLHTIISRDGKVIADMDESIKDGYDVHPMDIYLDNIKDDDESIAMLNDILFGLRHMDTKITKVGDSFQLLANGEMYDYNSDQKITMDVDLQIAIAFPMQWGCC